MSSLTLKGGKSSEQGPYASASSSMPPTSAVPDSSSSMQLTKFIYLFCDMLQWLADNDNFLAALFKY